MVLEENGRQRVTIDGRAHGEWEAIGFSHLVWSMHGAVYPVLSNERWRLVVGTRRSPAHRAIGDIVVSGQHVAYAALEDDGWHVVVDGTPGPAFQALRARSLLVSEEGRVLYIARASTGEHAVIDGVVGPAFERIFALGFGGKGRLVGYVGHGAGDSRIVVDGRASEPVDDVLELALAEDEARWAAVVQRGDAHFVLHDGLIVSAPGRSFAELRIAPDGRHVAWLAEEGEATSVFRDGRRVGTHDEVSQLLIVPRTGAVLYVADEDGGARVVHGETRGPLVRSVVSIATSDAGHFGYVARHGIGRVVVVDGEVRHRGDWAGALTLAARGDRWAFIARRAGRRFVVTPEGRTPVGRPFVDTLVLDSEGRHWALAVPDRRTRRVDVIVDGNVVAPLDFDEVSAAMQAGGSDPVEVVRRIVRGELERALRSRGTPPRAVHGD